jgi:hypothetical protein
MWHALRAELVYFRPWMLGGLGIAFGVAILLTVLTRVFGDGSTPRFLIAMFPIIAGMVVAFIAQSYRVEERRVRLLFAGPLTPTQLAMVMILLPPCLVAVGAFAGALLIWLDALIFGRPDFSVMATAAGFGGQFLAYAQLGPLAQEASAAHRQRRTRASWIGWLIFAAAIPVTAVFYFSQETVVLFGHFWHLVAVGMIMVATVVLYRGRTDFTR